MDIDILKTLINDGFSTYKIAKELNTSQTNVRYWIKKFNQSTKFVKVKYFTSDKEIIDAVLNSISFAGVIRVLKRSITGASYKWLHKEIKRLQLNIEHFKGQSHGLSVHKNKVSYEQLLTKNTIYTISRARKIALIKNGFLENVCQICGINPEWNNKVLVLRLDHINGDHYDNQLYNLRLVCPNCDSQLPTFCGRNIKHRKLIG